MQNTAPKRGIYSSLSQYSINLFKKKKNSTPKINQTKTINDDTGGQLVSGDSIGDVQNSNQNQVSNNGQTENTNENNI